MCCTYNFSIIMLIYMSLIAELECPVFHSIILFFFWNSIISKLDCNLHGLFWKCYTTGHYCCRSHLHHHLPFMFSLHVGCLATKLLCLPTIHCPQFLPMFYFPSVWRLRICGTRYLFIHYYLVLCYHYLTVYLHSVSNLQIWHHMRFVLSHVGILTLYQSSMVVFHNCSDFLCLPTWFTQFCSCRTADSKCIRHISPALSLKHTANWDNSVPY